MRRLVPTAHVVLFTTLLLVFVHTQQGARSAPSSPQPWWASTRPSETTTGPAAAESARAFLRSLPRLAWTGSGLGSSASNATKHSHTHSNSTYEWDPTSPLYLEGVALTGAPLLALGGLWLLACLLAALVAGCCCCFDAQTRDRLSLQLGGRGGAHGVRLSRDVINQSDDAEDYAPLLEDPFLGDSSAAQRPHHQIYDTDGSGRSMSRRVRAAFAARPCSVATVVLAGLVFVCAAYAFFQLAAFRGTLSAGVDLVISTENKLVSDLRQIERNLTELDLIIGDDPAKDKDLKLVKDVLKQAGVAQDLSHQVDEAMSMGVEIAGDVQYGVLVLVAVTCVLAVAAALLGTRGLACPAVTIAVVIGPLLLVATGVSVPYAVFTSDMCPDVETFVLNRTTSDSATSFLEYYLVCTPPDPPDPLQNTTRKACDSATVLKFVRDWTLSMNKSKPFSPICNKTTIPPTIACLDNAIDRANDVCRSLNDLGNCTRVRDVWLTAKDDVCINLLLQDVAFDVAAIGAAFLLGIMVLGLCFGPCRDGGRLLRASGHWRNGGDYSRHLDYGQPPSGDDGLGEGPPQHGSVREVRSAGPSLQQPNAEQE